MSDIPANIPDFWRTDAATDDFRKKYAAELSQPENMSNGRLCLAVTYCRKIMNPFAVELVRRAGVWTSSWLCRITDILFYAERRGRSGANMK